MADGMASIVTSGESPGRTTQRRNLQDWLRRVHRGLLDSHDDDADEDSWSCWSSCSYYSWSCDSCGSSCSTCESGCSGCRGQRSCGDGGGGYQVNIYNQCSNHGHREAQGNDAAGPSDGRHAWGGEGPDRRDKADESGSPSQPHDRRRRGWKKRLGLEDLIHTATRRRQRQRRHGDDAKGRVQDWVRVMDQLEDGGGGGDDGEVVEVDAETMAQLRAALERGRGGGEEQRQGERQKGGDGVDRLEGGRLERREDRREEERRRAADEEYWQRQRMREARYARE